MSNDVSSRTEGALLAPKYPFTPAQVRDAHNSFHIWRSLCFLDSSMAQPDARYPQKWAALEQAAIESDRTAGMSPARLRERAERRMNLRLMVKGGVDVTAVSGREGN